MTAPLNGVSQNFYGVFCRAFNSHVQDRREIDALIG
jgi:hypothetical protein